MALRTMDAIQQHAQKQKADAGPVPAVLSKVLESDYTGARKLLDAQRTSLSPSLVALLDADLTYESNDQKTGTLKLVDMYQAAYDIQVCDLNRDFIQNRIRQLRYGL